MLPTPVLANTYSRQNQAVDEVLERQREEMDYLSRLQRAKDNQEQIERMRNELNDKEPEAKATNPLPAILGLAVVGGLVYSAVKASERDVHIHRNYYGPNYRYNRRGYRGYGYRY